MSESFGPGIPAGGGMGRPSGPDFAGPAVPGAGPDTESPRPSWPPSAEPSPAAVARPPAPPRNRLPSVLAAVAIAVVALVVVLASVWAGQQDARQAAPSPQPSRPASASPLPGSQIEFTGDAGTGVLRIVRHSWDPAGPTAAGKSLLTLEIAVSCTSGTLRYGPDSFDAFDQDGGLFESAYDPDSSTALEFIRLTAGEQVSGTVSFEIPRGDVTLLLSDDLSRPIAALKVPD
ncbi:MAG: hypothetical protein QM650_19550 [Microlunatus sp.]